MFGEEPLLGANNFKIDDKHRIWIPSSTKREPGEELVIAYNKNLKCYEIYSINSIEKRFKNIISLIDNAPNKKDKQFYERMLKELSSSILLKSKVDSQGRISVSKIFEEYDELISTGAYDRLIIEPKKK